MPAKREGTSEQQRPRLRVEARANNYRAYTAFTTQAPRPEAVRSCALRLPVSLVPRFDTFRESPLRRTTPEFARSLMSSA